MASFAKGALMTVAIVMLSLAALKFAGRAVPSLKNVPLLGPTFE